MTDVEIIKPDEDEECCCCKASNVRLRKWTEEMFDKATHQHCDLCYETFAGNTCVYPKNYEPDTARIMQHVNLVANLLIREMRGSR